MIVRGYEGENGSGSELESCVISLVYRILALIFISESLNMPADNTIHFCVNFPTTDTKN